MNPEYPYSSALFDEQYYGGGARGGFQSYAWEDPAQQQQLRYKWDHCQQHGDFHSILFVGCATGFEVKYFSERKKEAWGVDVSEWAIAHPVAGVAGFIDLFDGRHLSDFGDNDIDVVTSFDVLSLVPDDMMKVLAAEMVRVARKKIVVRTIVKNFRNLQNEWDGNDGVSFKYSTFTEWDRLFCQSGKFALHEAMTHAQYETIFVFARS
jgi:hypothetical protein